MHADLVIPVRRAPAPNASHALIFIMQAVHGLVMSGAMSMHENISALWAADGLQVSSRYEQEVSIYQALATSRHDVTDSTCDPDFLAYPAACRKPMLLYCCKVPTSMSTASESVSCTQ
jgi:hypothetical protein